MTLAIPVPWNFSMGEARQLPVAIETLRVWHIKKIRRAWVANNPAG